MQDLDMEMNVFEAILARRSVRSYAAREIDRTQLHTLLEAAVRAPTAMHGEPWAFAVVQDRHLLQTLSDRAKPLFQEEVRRAGMEEAAGRFLDEFSRPDFNFFYDAGTLIIIGSMATGPFVAADCWLAAENLMLAACAMGLGTCVVGSVLPTLGLAEIKSMLGLPDQFSAIAPIICGYSRGESSPASRKKPVVLTNGFAFQ